MTVMTLRDYDEGHGPEIGASPRLIFCLKISMYLALMHPSIRLFLGNWPMHESFRELYPSSQSFSVPGRRWPEQKLEQSQRRRGRL